MNSREIASVAWLALVLVAGATKPDVHAAYWQVIKSFLHPKVLGSVVVLAAWTVGLAALAHQIGLWESDVLSDTVVWFLTVGIAFYFSLQSVGERGFFRRTARRAVGAAVFVEVFVNLRVFSLPVELVLVPFVSFVVMLRAYTEGKDEYRPAHRLANLVLSLIGAVFVVYVTASLMDDLKAEETTRKLLLPVWLTLGVMPLIYAVGLWSAYEQAFVRIDLATDDRASRRRAKWALLRVAHLRASDVSAFSRHWIRDLASAESSEAAQRIMRRFRATWRAKRHAERLTDARASMRLWLNEPDPALADIHEGVLRGGWERLDAEQRATLRSEASRSSAVGTRLDALRALPD